MRKYEVAVMLHPDLEIDPAAPMSRVEEAFSGVDAEIKKRDEWGKRKLAYPISGQTFGIYVFYVLDVDQSRVADIEHSLRMNEEVMRHLIVAYDEHAQPDDTSDDAAGRRDEDKAKQHQNKADTDSDT